MRTALAAGASVLVACAATAGTSQARTQTRSATVTGGHQTKGVDNGRPVALIAAALGVPESVFRTAFSKVTPAPAGSEPEGEQVQRNKEALLSVLADYGVTNEALDRVSNHYRYVGSAGELWPTKAAVVRAIVKDGKVSGFKIISGGSGYTSAPAIKVAGHPELKARAKLAFSKTFAHNGRVISISLR